MDQQRIIQRLKELRPEANYTWDDLGDSRLLSDVIDDVCRYNPTAKSFFYFDCQRWKKDDADMETRQLTKQVARSLVIYANELEDDGRYLKHAIKWNQARKRDFLVRDARDNSYFATRDLDTNDYLLNLQNGVIKLTSTRYEFIEHSPDLLLSKIANVSYDPSAEAERWLSFLDEIMEGDQEKIRYLQKLFGLCLSGDTQLERMWFFHGPSTRNGKSTLLETISYLLGDYATSIQAETLAMKSNPDSRRPSPDIAKLRGVRLVIASETPRGMLLDVRLVNNLSGNDKIVARFLHEQELEFYPKFKLCVNCNHLPRSTDSTLFDSNRVHVVKFNRHFKESEQDTTLKARFRKPTMLSGILNWMLEGWTLYQEEGLKASTGVEYDSRAYARDCDKIRAFIDDCLEVRPKSNLAIKDVYAAYVDWCKSLEYEPDQKGRFTSELKERGLYKPRGMVDGKQVRNLLSGYAFPVDINDVAPWDMEDFDVD